MKINIIKYICLFCVASFSYANESELLEDFNNNLTLLADSASKDSNYAPSFQIAKNDRSQIPQKQLEDALYIEKLLAQWSHRLSNKYSGHYWVLMAKEDNKVILESIAKVQPTTRISLPNMNMEILIDGKKKECDLLIKTKIGDSKRIENIRNYNFNSGFDVAYVSSYSADGKYYCLYSLIVK